MLRIFHKQLSVAAAAGAVMSLFLHIPGTAAAAGSPQGGMAGQDMMAGVNLRMPKMDPAHGRKLFASKGCVVCHSINGVGGEDAPKLDASTMAPNMDPFDFAAKMWHGAPAMIMMQKEELGAQIEFTGGELADIIAFAHSPAEQKKFSEADIPENIKELMEHEEESDAHKEDSTAQHKD